MHSSILTNEEIIELGKSLPRGAKARIARKLKRDYTGVKKVLDGKAFSRDVIEAAIVELESNSDLRKRFQNLKSKSA